jgi:copper homeostasis protein
MLYSIYRITECNYKEKNGTFIKPLKNHKMDFRLEICVDSVESAVNAQTGGAHRNNLTIDVNVIIRPRGGDFLYSDTEYDIMRQDIDMCGECGVNGIVIGILHPDGEIDVERTSRLIELANPMSVTFHRAFDMCNDPFRGLQDIISSGASRLLTSGQKNNAFDGAGLIAKLVKKAGSRLIIMPGSGLNESNIAEAARITGATEFHLSVRSSTYSEMIFRREGIDIGGVPDIPGFSRRIADPERIKNIINILKMI